MPGGEVVKRFLRKGRGRERAATARVSRARGSLRPVGPRDGHRAFLVLAAALDAQEPRIAADLAVLHEAAADVALEVDLDVLAAVRTVDDEILFHPARYIGVTRPISITSGRSVVAVTAPEASRVTRTTGEISSVRDAGTETTLYSTCATA